MSKIRINQFAQLKYHDPRPILVRLREVEIEVSGSNLSPEVKHLRTNALKPDREKREAALFCHGIGQRIGETVYLAWSEAQDHDFITLRTGGYAPVQLKEVVPTHLNPAASVQNVINGLVKYVDSEELVVAIHLNQRLRFDPSSVHIPELRIRQLWIFFAISEDQSEWGLCGNLLESAEVTIFSYPT